MNCYHETGKVELAKIDLYNLARACYNVNKVIALGKFASTCLTKIGVSHFELPHPSGLNRKLNDKSYTQNKLEECRKFCFPEQ